jgi:DNA-directed RNA polymerase subunit RPC12/RpoP|tara:strand:- start:102 stop:206 length:105 start_codon:yes stop_codon:yes gene_type:complete
MIKWWFCSECEKVTDEFESEDKEKCPDCREKEDE